jgi:hypothetical protein
MGWGVCWTCDSGLKKKAAGEKAKKADCKRSYNGCFSDYGNGFINLAEGDTITVIADADARTVSYSVLIAESGIEKNLGVCFKDVDFISNLDHDELADNLGKVSKTDGSENHGGLYFAVAIQQGVAVKIKSDALRSSVKTKSHFKLAQKGLSAFGGGIGSRFGKIHHGDKKKKDAGDASVSGSGVGSMPSGKAQGQGSRQFLQSVAMVLWGSATCLLSRIGEMRLHQHPMLLSRYDTHLLKKILLLGQPSTDSNSSTNDSHEEDYGEVWWTGQKKPTMTVAAAAKTVRAAASPSKASRAVDLAAALEAADAEADAVEAAEEDEDELRREHLRMLTRTEKTSTQPAGNAGRRLSAGEIARAAEEKQQEETEEQAHVRWDLLLQCMLRPGMMEHGQLRSAAGTISVLGQNRWLAMKMLRLGGGDDEGEDEDEEDKREVERRHSMTLPSRRSRKRQKRHGKRDSNALIEPGTPGTPRSFRGNSNAVPISAAASVDEENNEGDSDESEEDEEPEEDIADIETRRARAMEELFGGASAGGLHVLLCRKIKEVWQQVGHVHFVENSKGASNAGVGDKSGTKGTDSKIKEGSTTAAAATSKAKRHSTAKGAANVGTTAGANVLSEEQKHHAAVSLRTISLLGHALCTLLAQAKLTDLQVLARQHCYEDVLSPLLSGWVSDLLTHERKRRRWLEQQERERRRQSRWQQEDRVNSERKRAAFDATFHQNADGFADDKKVGGDEAGAGTTAAGSPSARAMPGVDSLQFNRLEANATGGDGGGQSGDKPGMVAGDEATELMEVLAQVLYFMTRGCMLDSEEAKVLASTRGNTTITPPQQRPQNGNVTKGGLINSGSSSTRLSFAAPAPLISEEAVLTKEERAALWAQEDDADERRRATPRFILRGLLLVISQCVSEYMLQCISLSVWHLAHNKYNQLGLADLGALPILILVAQSPSMPAMVNIRQTVASSAASEGLGLHRQKPSTSVGVTGDADAGAANNNQKLDQTEASYWSQQWLSLSSSINLDPADMPCYAMYHEQYHQQLYGTSDTGGAAGAGSASEGGIGSALPQSISHARCPRSLDAVLGAIFLVVSGDIDASAAETDEAVVEMLEPDRSRLQFDAYCAADAAAQGRGVNLTHQPLDTSAGHSHHHLPVYRLDHDGPQMGLRIPAAELLCRVCPLGPPALRNLAYSEVHEKAAAATEYGRDGWQKQALTTVPFAKRVGDACSGFFGGTSEPLSPPIGISQEPLSPSMVAPPLAVKEPPSPIQGIGGPKANIGGAGSAFQPSASTTNGLSSPSRATHTFTGTAAGTGAAFGAGTGRGSPVGFSLGGVNGVGYTGAGSAVGVGGDGGSGSAYSWAAKRYRGLALPSIGSMWEDESVHHGASSHTGTGMGGTSNMEHGTIGTAGSMDGQAGHALGALDFLTRLFTSSLENMGMGMGMGSMAGGGGGGTGALDLALLITLRVARDANARQLMLGSPSFVVGLLGVTANQSLLPRHRKNACAALQWLSVTEEGRDAIVAITDALVTEYGRRHHNSHARARFGASPSAVSRSATSRVGTPSTAHSEMRTTSVASHGSTCTSPTSSIGTGSPTYASSSRNGGLYSPSPFPSEGGHYTGEHYTGEHDDGSDDDGLDDDRDGFASQSPTRFGTGGRSPKPGSSGGGGGSGGYATRAPYVQRRIADDIPLALIDDVLDLMHTIPPHAEAEVLEKMKKESEKAAAADASTPDAPPAALNMSLGSGKQAFHRQQQKMACGMVLEALTVMLLHAPNASLMHYAAVCLCHTACDKGARQRLSRLSSLSGRLGTMVEDGLVTAMEFEEKFEAREMLITRWRGWRQQQIDEEQAVAAAEARGRNKGKRGGGGGGAAAASGAARERTATSGSVVEAAGNGGARERTTTSGSATSEWSSTSEFHNDDPLAQWLYQWGDDREPASLELTQAELDALVSCQLAANVLLNLSHDKPAQAQIAKSILLPLLLHILRLNSLPWPLALAGSNESAGNDEIHDNSGGETWARVQAKGTAGVQAIKDLRMAIQGIVANVYSNPKARTAFYKAEVSTFSVPVA